LKPAIIKKIVHRRKKKVSKKKKKMALAFVERKIEGWEEKWFGG